MIIFGNFITPIFAGAIFLLYFVYFKAAYRTPNTALKIFSFFLFTFSLFIFTRPLQLSCGPHPAPLIIADIRMFALCSVIAPSYYLFNVALHGPLHKRTIIAAFLVGSIPASLYVIFHTLGTIGSYELLRVDQTVFYDNNVPSHLPPFYGREVSQAMQIISPIIFFMGSFVYSALKSKSPTTTLSKKSMIYINSATLIFAIAMVIGGLIKQWTVYYIASVPSVVLVGYGVILNVREMCDKIDRLVPIIKEELLQDPSFILTPRDKTKELIDASGLSVRPDTVILCRIDDQTHSRGSFSISNELRETIIRLLDSKLGVNSYVLISLGRSGIAICCSLSNVKNTEYAGMELAEAVRAEIEHENNISATIGIGCTYSDFSKLRFSYQEAFLAQEYAARIGKNIVVYYKGIQEVKHNQLYPLQLKDSFLSELRLGNRSSAEEILSDYLARLQLLSNNDLSHYRFRIMELAVFASETATTAGLNHQKVFELEYEFFEEIASINDIETINIVLFNFIGEYISRIIDIPKDRNAFLIEKAKTYICSNFEKNITVDSVALSMHISPSHFMRIFKEREGVTFNNYLTQVRIDKARELLANSSKNITEIAFDVGFNDSNYFSTVFSKTVKATPSDYRTEILRKKQSCS